MFFLFSLSGRKGERESASGGSYGLGARPPSASPQAFAGRAKEAPVEYVTLSFGPS